MLPSVAQVAIRGGRYVASLIRRRVDGERSAKPFWYWDRDNTAIVGRTFAVAVTLQWAISFVTKRRGVRILPLAKAE